MSKVIVIGGGPAGMIAAIMAGRNNNEVTLIEKNKELGKKLKITGGGRCNITNMRDIEVFLDKIIVNHKFLYSSIYSFTNLDLLEFFKKHNLEFKVEEDLKVYPQNDKSEEIIEVLKKELKKSNVKVIYEKKFKDLLIEDNKLKGVILENKETIKGDKVIISTGGMSYPKTGSSGEVYKILKKHGHTINKIYPSLVPLIVKEKWIKNLQGVSMKDVKVTSKYSKNKKIEMTGDILFAHFGITGPVILNISSYLNKMLQEKEVDITIDFTPNIKEEEISKIIRKNPNKAIYNNLREILPLNFIKEILNYLDIDKKPNELNKQDEKRIIESIKKLKLTCIGTRSINEAIVTSGGISVKEINSSTMESKIINNLYFAGEVIDIEGLTGGYNLQIAFSTGYLAGISV
ncbi:BaiN/RdsA family NAD(P)/FAD-dependent oxidoreductase [Tepidibacter formicigenes]|jgi:predicted Rossmann fold flavoprotein|uniref:Flavoprotein, HI0933 family n=1 Tax=Tepidibacter formicigenes DSM 15518 TaxID=1123349 RepID=A0A1M6MA29_9FIRM|nr:NAD(P)/FAD-dependent oxidoreductase [Tepidibacter formicigenes]SHJ80297.1 hypothetical protein SAMN02744037_00873 [Tepidibacter formicigenes DSM 15518]